MKTLKIPPLLIRSKPMNKVQFYERNTFTTTQVDQIYISSDHKYYCPHKKVVVNMTVTMEFQKTKFHEPEFHLAMEKFLPISHRKPMSVDIVAVSCGNVYLCFI